MSFFFPRLSLSLLSSGAVHLGLMITLFYLPRFQPPSEPLWVELISATNIVPNTVPNRKESVSISQSEVKSKRRTGGKQKSIAEQHPIQQLQASEEVQRFVKASESSAELRSVDSLSTAEPNRPEDSNRIQDPYRSQIEAWLRKNKKYPFLAQRLRHQGHVLVSFTLSRDGRVIDSEILEVSSFESLNRSALGLVESLDGRFPFPVDAQEISRKFIVPIEYKL